MPRRAESMVRAVRDRLGDERGFGLVEVLMSAVVVGLAVTGVFTAFDASQATASRNKARNIAANLADQDQERMRGMKVASLSNLRQSSSKTVDGGTFTVTSRTDWLSDKTGTQSCTATDSSTDYLKLTTTVTATKLGALKPVTAESIQAVPNGSFGPGQGSVVAQITDRNGNGVSGLSVSLVGASSFSETTNANGCAIFGYLAVGTYTLSFSRSGWVESTYPNRQDISDSVVVAGESTSRKAYMYDAAGSASVRFINSAGAVVNGSSFTVSHASLTPINYKTIAGGPATTLSTSGLFPFTSAYSVWAGCQGARPMSNGQATDPSALVPAGGSVGPVDVRQPTLTVTVRNSSNALVNGAKVVITPTIAGCAPTTTGTTPASGLVAAALPYGVYNVCAQNTVNSPTRRIINAAVNNKTTAGSAVTMTLPGSNTTPNTCP